MLRFRTLIKLRTRKSLNLGLVCLIFFSSGCVSRTRSFHDVSPVTPSDLERRDLAIQVNTWDDRRVKLDKGSEYLLLLPLWPYTVKHYQTQGVPPSKEYFEKHRHDRASILRKKANYQVATYDIPSLLCEYITASNLTDRVYLEGELFQNQLIAHPNKIQGIPLQCDIIIQPRLNSFEEWEIITCYGTGLVGLAGTLLFMTGFQRGVDIDFILSATEPGNPARVVAEKRYQYKESSPFHPIAGIYQFGKENAYDLIGIRIHQACDDFVQELDRVLPPSSDMAYWSEVRRKRDQRLHLITVPPEVEFPRPVIPVSPVIPSIRRNWAVVIGISSYQYAGSDGLVNLKFAEKDALDFYNALISQGWFDSHIKLLINDEATKENITAALEGFLTKTSPEDLILLYWSGHGFPDPEIPEKVYFVCYDTRITKPYTGYRMDKVREALEERGVRNVIVLADTCHAGKLVTRGDKNLSIQPYILDVQEKNDVPAGWVFMVSSETDRKAIEHSSWSNGAFTHCLLEALEGTADGYLSSGLKDGIITLSEIRCYLENAMPEKTQQVLGIAKHPLIATTSGSPEIWQLSLHGGQQSSQP